MLKTINGQVKQKRVIGFSVDPELDAKIEAYAAANGISKSGAMRQLIIIGLYHALSLSKPDGEVKRT